MPERIDDLSITSEELLWRRLHPKWVIHNEDGSFRVSSAAFKDGRHEVSVDIATLTAIEDSLAGFTDQGLAELQAGVSRSLGHAVVRDPLPENVAHALICEPLPLPHSKRERDAKTMSREAIIIRMPLFLD